MENTKLVLDLEIGYESISIPHKIVIPIRQGKIGIWSYKQHKTDPLAVEKIKIEYAGEERIMINMRGTGRLDINNFPDLRIGGTKIRIDAGMKIENRKLSIQNPKLARLDLPNVPNFADNILREILNKNIGKLTEDINVDIHAILEDIRGQINKPIPFKIKLDHARSEYELGLNLEPIKPEFTITPGGIHLRLYMPFKPTITRIQQAII